MQVDMETVNPCYVLELVVSTMEGSPNRTLGNVRTAPTGNDDEGVSIHFCHPKAGPVFPAVAQVHLSIVAFEHHADGVVSWCVSNRDYLYLFHTSFQERLITIPPLPGSSAYAIFTVQCVPGAYERFHSVALNVFLLTFVTMANTV